MRILVLAVLALFASQATVAGHHEESLKLAKRQADTTMTVTSINLGDNGTTIPPQATWVNTVRYTPLIT